MDPRQRSADRRRFLRIAVFILVGLAFICFSAVLSALPIEESPTTRGYPIEFGYFFGTGWIAVAIFDLLRRAVSGPTKPGKRARY